MIKLITLPRRPTIIEGNHIRLLYPHAQNELLEYLKANAIQEKELLPADLDGQNDDRAAAAHIALVAFAGTVAVDADEAVPLLLCYLMHWCDHVRGVDFRSELDHAVTQYKNQTATNQTT